MLEEQYRKRLDRITAQLEAEGLPEQDVLETVNDFKSIYDPDAQHDESDFKDWYNQQRLQLIAQGVDLSPNPDAPEHFYNYRAAYRSGQGPDETGHWPSRFKKEGHPELIVNGVDTRTGKEPDWEMFENPTPYFEQLQQTALAPKRSAQVTSAPAETMEVPVENVRAEQMQLQGPENQPQIMEPAAIHPSSYGAELAGAAGGAFKRMAGATGQETARKLKKPIRQVNPEWATMGRNILARGGPQNQQEQFYVDQYNRQLQQEKLQESVRPFADKLQKISADIQESIPENDRMAVEEAQSYLTSEAAKKPSNIGRTISATLLVAADQSANTAAGIAGAVPGLEGIPAFTMVAQEKQGWIDAAKKMGITDEELLDRWGDNYAIPSGALEYVGSAIVGAPVRGLIKGKVGKAGAAAKIIPKSVISGVMKNAAKGIGSTIGAAGLEGLTEMSQQELQNVVMYFALSDAAKKDPENAEKYTIARDEIELNPVNKETLDSFILGFAASLPQNIAARILGGIGRKVGGFKKGIQPEAQAAPTPTPQPPQPSMPVPEPTPASLTEQQEKTMPARQRRAGEMVAQADQIMPGQIKTEDDLFKVARGIRLKMGVKSFEELFLMDAKQLGEKMDLLNAKEQQFIQEMPLDEIEAYKVPETSPPAKVVKSTEGTKQTYIPGEAGSIVPPQTTETQNVPEQEEKGRLQVAPVPEKPMGKAKSLTFEEFEALPSQEKQRQYEMNPSTQRPGQNGFNRVFTERTNSLTKQTTIAAGDINGFKEYNDKLLGPENTDRYNSQLFDIIEKHAGEGNVFNIHGDEYMVFGKSPEQVQQALKNAMEEIGSKPFKGNDGKEHKTSMSWMVTETSDPVYLGNLPLKTVGKNTIGVDKNLGNAYTSIKGSDAVSDQEIIKRSEVVNENDLSRGVSGKPETGRKISQPVEGRTAAVTEKQPAAAPAAAPTQEVVTTPAAPVEKQVAPAEEVPPEQREIRVYTAKPEAEKKTRQPQKSVAPVAEKIEKAEIPATEPEGAKAFNRIFKEALTQQKNQQKAEAKALGKVPKQLRGKINIRNSKEPPASAKSLLGKSGEWEAAVWYNPENKVVEIYINENLPADKYAEALYHEIPGHIGQRLVFADSPAIQNTMRQMYGAAKARGDVALRGLERAYKADIAQAGERGDDVLFEEWTAHNLHRYLIENDRTSLPRRIYNLFRSALVKMGIVKAKIDDVLREMVKKMSRAKDMGVIEKELKESFKRPVYSQQQESEEASVAPGEVNLDIDDETKAEMFRRIVTDRNHRLRTLMESVEKKTGKPLPDDLNAYVKNDIINSKIKQKVDDFAEKYINPIVDIAAKNGLDVAQVDQYLYAKHAEEANRVVGERRPDMVEEGVPPSGMSNEKANEILAAAEKSGKKEALEKISDLVQQWNKARLDMMVKEELLTEEQRAALEEEYKNYVPLKGIDDEQTREELPRVGKGLTVPRKEYYMRKGRTSEAKNILAHLVQDTVEKSVRGEKNKVLRALYDFSKTFKNDLIITEPVVYEKAFNKKEGVYETRRRTKFDVKDMSTYGLPVDFKINGEPQQMLIRDVPLMRAMRNMGTDEADIFTKIITKGIMPIQRYMALVRTQLSVNFIPSNALRDTMTAQLNALGLGLPKEQQKGLAFEILKSVPKALKWAYEGQTGGETEGAKKYKEFVREGGAIEFFGMKDIEQTQKSLIRQLNNMKPGALAASRRVMRDAFNYITILNGSVENANRLATYTALVKRGVSKQQAAYIAKNITVNFNRKGEVGTFLNAWALFANAGIQGSVRILKALKDSPTVRAAAAGIVVTSFGIAELMRQVMGDDPDDDENYYDKVTDFIKDTHMVLPYKMFGGKSNGYIRIPLPYGYNVFWALGQNISKAMHHPAKEIPAEALHVIGTVADAFNPIGGAVNLADPKDVIRNFTPTILQPVAELAVNQNFMGAPVYKEPSGAFGPQPVAAHQALKSTPQAIKDATAWANDVTGGSMYRRGVANVSPDVVKYLIDFATGGVGKLGTDLINMPFEWVSNKKVPARGVPLLQRFVGDVNEYKDVKKLYDNLEEARRIYKDYEAYKTSDPEKAVKIRKEYPGVISLFNKIEREIQTKDFKTRKVKQTTLNAAIVKPLQRMNELKKRLDEGKKKEAAERIEKEIVNHAQRSNAALEDLLKPKR